MGKEYERRITVLGSVPHLGPVVLHDDLEDLFKWNETGVGGDTVFEKIETKAFNGSACLHMKTRTTGAVENDWVNGNRKCFQRPGKRYRFEVVFMPDADQSAKELRFWAVVNDGTLGHEIHIQYMPVTMLWSYKKLGGGYATFPGSTQYLSPNDWHRMLFEWDESRKFITRLVCDGMELRGLELEYFYDTVTEVRSMWVEVGLVTGNAPPGEAYFDEVLVLEI